MLVYKSDILSFWLPLCNSVRYSVVLKIIIIRGLLLVHNPPLIPITSILLSTAK